MPALSANDLTTRFDVATQIDVTRVQACVDTANRWARRKIGIEAFNQIFAGDTSTVTDSEYLDENTTTTDEDALRLGEVTDAVMFFAMAEVVANCNLRIRPSGQVKEEQDAGSPAMTASTQIINKYLSPAEVKEWITELRGNADALISPYVIEQEPVNPWGVSKLVRA